MPWALVLALANAGKSIAAKIAIIAMTTSSSIRVKPAPADGRTRARQVLPGGVSSCLFFMMGDFGDALNQLARHSAETSEFPMECEGVRGLAE